MPHFRTSDLKGMWDELAESNRAKDNLYVAKTRIRVRSFRETYCAASSTNYIKLLLTYLPQTSMYSHRCHATHSIILRYV